MINTVHRQQLTIKHTFIHFTHPIGSPSATTNRLIDNETKTNKIKKVLRKKKLSWENEV